MRKVIKFSILTFFAIDIVFRSIQIVFLALTYIYLPEPIELRI